jgi:hypothetical protein
MGDGAEEHWRSDLRSVLHDIFFKYAPRARARMHARTLPPLMLTVANSLLQANPTERPVVVCESLLTPQFFRSALADLLLRYLQVSAASS